MIGIYYTKNEVNGKLYIGQSRKVEIRLIQHKSDLRNIRHTNVVLQSAWNKYGEENFSFGALVECKEQDLNDLEIHWINKLQSDRHLNGYNIEKGGNCSPVSEETKRKISEANKGKKRSDTFKINQSNRMKGKFSGALNHRYGKPISDEQRKKMNEGIKNRIITDEEREHRRILATNISDSTRKKRSESLSGDKNPMWGRTGILSPNYGRTLTDEQKHHLSEINKGKKQSTEVCEKLSLQRYGKPRGKKTSKYVGVSRNGWGRWSAFITIDGKNKNLGSYKSEEEAAEAYNKALEIRINDIKITKEQN